MEDEGCHECGWRGVALNWDLGPRSSCGRMSPVMLARQWQWPKGQGAAPQAATERRMGGYGSSEPTGRQQTTL